MRLLVDTDIFCKLSVAGLFDEAVLALGVDRSECGRLPALPYMLRRGRLRSRYGDAVSDALIPLADAVPSMPAANAEWLDKFAGIPEIDPGEAQLFALAAQGQLIAASGDKRALRAIKDIPEVCDALAGRLVVLEAVLIRLCDEHGVSAIRARIDPIRAVDTVIQVCFSSGSPDPVSGLLSYYDSLTRELAPLELWKPRSEAT